MKKYFLVMSLGTLVLWAQEKPIIAVLQFTNPSQKFYLDEVCKSLPSLLKTELSQSKSILVVEREKMDAVLQEQDFVMSDLSEDKDKSAKVGSLLGADFLITGVVTESDGKIRVDVSITKTSNGQVTAEKVIGPSKEKLTPMAKLLAHNVVFNLSGDGERLKKITLTGSPTLPFAVVTAALAVGAGVTYSGMKTARKDYRSATDLSKIDNHYDKANKLKKTSGLLTGLAAGAFVGTVYCIIKNATSNLEVTAQEGIPMPKNFAVGPILRSEGAGVYFNFSF